MCSPTYGKGMTDKEILLDMIKRAGYEGDLTYVEADSFCVERGYFGFVCSFEFNDDGSLKDIGAYE